MITWLPIKWAPDDGTFVLLRGPSGYTSTPYRVSMGRYSADRQDWVDHANDRFTDGGPQATHFAWADQWVDETDQEQESKHG